MQIASRLPWSVSSSGALVQAHVRGQLPEALRAPGLSSLPALAARTPMAPDLVRALAADGEGAAALQTLAAPGALAVATGQQPGCVGGAVFVVLKAATAVALARRSARALGRPVVPVFWNAADDVDFDEVSRVGWLTAAGELFFLELPAAGRQAQGFVGDLPAAGDEAAASAALSLLDGARRDALQPLLPRGARDHADWVGRLLRAVFPELVVVDARHPALRTHAAPLFRRYLEAADAATEAIETRAAALAAAGFAPTLSPSSTRQALFLVDGGRRLKVRDDRAPLRQALERAPESVAANVVLRPLIQDTLFPVLASVVGPAEIGYLHESRALRPLLGVPESALVPRLALTLVGTNTWEAAQRHGIDAERLLAHGEAALREAARRRAREPRQRVEAAFGATLGALGALVPSGNTALERPLRRLEGVRDDFIAALEDAAVQELLRAEPALERLSQRLRPRGRAQERVLATLWFLARRGIEARQELLQLADMHLDTLEQGDVVHWLVLD